VDTNSSKHMKERIVDTFVSLLRTRKLTNITINDICTSAEISRSTFYRYFSDIYGLLEAFILRFHNEAVVLSKGRTRHEAISIDFDHIEKYEAQLKNLVMPETDAYVYTIMLKIYTEAIYAELVAQEKQGRRFSTSLDFLADFFAAGLCHVQVKWIKGEYKREKQQMIDDITQLLLRAGLGDHV